MENSFIYLRGLKIAEHIVFFVECVQKHYFYNHSNRIVPFSSGQQVKRSILQEVVDELNEQIAPIVFNYHINKKNVLENKEPWSPCDPNYVDQLVGGWLRAKKA